MATDTEYDYVSAERSLPAPSDAPYRAPSRSKSRTARSQSRRESSPSDYRSSGHPLSPDGPSDLDDVIHGDSLSPLDPRRFTPTLHASLVSEILSLRREVENKTKVIDDLERSLDDSRTENESLTVDLVRNTNETRSLKHQLHLLEGGTSSALTELAKERDDALENVSEVRKKLESAQKKIRSREEEIERTQSIWDRERDAWESERRNLERKVHVVEGRLKVVLSEVEVAVATAAAAAAAKAQVTGHQPEHADDFRGELMKQASTARRQSDQASVHSDSPDWRRTSVTSVSTENNDVPNARYSVISIANQQHSQNSGLNLAEELAFEEADEEASVDGTATPDSPGALPEERPTSVHSQISMSAKARKILGLSLDSLVDSSGILDQGELLRSPDRTGIDYYYDPAPELELQVQRSYQDAGIQYSPPASPTPPVGGQSTRLERGFDGSNDRSTPSPTPTTRLYETSGGDRSSSSSSSSSSNNSNSNNNSSVTLTIDMVSTSCQTVSELPTPPWTPRVFEEQSSLAERAERTGATTEQVSMISASTQTDSMPCMEGIQNKSAGSPSTAKTSSSGPEMQIPMIAIHPPCSDPPSPRDSVVLPPQTKSVSCQTTFSSLDEGRSVGIQTEEIRVDKRAIKLPASLLPSAIVDQPSNLMTGPHDVPIRPYRAPPPRSLARERRVQRADDGVNTMQAYPGGNDNGPLSADSKSAGISRPFRSSSLFAGFEQASDEESPRVGASAFTDDELLNRPFASYTLKKGKMVAARDGRPSKEGDRLSEIDEHIQDYDTAKDVGRSSSPTRFSEESTISKSRDQDGVVSSSSRAHARSSAGRHQQQQHQQQHHDMRRSAMISSGAAAHQQQSRARARSPSDPSVDSGSVASSSIAPPFPVPMRLSSRNVARKMANHDEFQSPPQQQQQQQQPPWSARDFSEHGGRIPSPTLVRRPTLRRVRSAAAMSQQQTEATFERSTSQSPSAVSMSSYGYDDSPPIPPMPFDEITAPRGMRSTSGTSVTAEKTQQRKIDRSRNVAGGSGSNSGAYERDNTAAVASMQQTSVVDAIAQTMVGEWMFKYVRRRKSFGVSDATAREHWDGGAGAGTADELSASITSSGVRHKRWVWLAPYERAVMWSSKQPTSGQALLGKSGRKLTIQSVLDVRDDNPLPKGAAAGAAAATAQSPHQQHFHRSILILTPQRALKFTALTIERHFIWLTALSFLSHSEMGLHDLASLPPAPAEEQPLRHGPSAGSTGASLRRLPIRDSIRVAKGKPRGAAASSSKSKRSFLSTASSASRPSVPDMRPRMTTMSLGFGGGRANNNSHFDDDYYDDGNYHTDTYDNSKSNYNNHNHNSNNKTFGSHFDYYFHDNNDNGVVDDDADDADAADPPIVPRFSSNRHHQRHSRKRSNTSTTVSTRRGIPGAIRSFSSQPTFAASASAAGTPTTANMPLPYGMRGASAAGSPDTYGALASGRSSFSRRTSEASGPSSIGGASVMTSAATASGTGNFFDAVGTVRMEAFVDFSESSSPSRARYYRGGGAGGGAGGGGGRHSRKPSTSSNLRQRRALEHAYEDGRGGQEDPFLGF